MVRAKVELANGQKIELAFDGMNAAIAWADAHHGDIVEINIRPIREEHNGEENDAD